jgi:hypothetical protein
MCSSMRWAGIVRRVHEPVRLVSKHSGRIRENQTGSQLKRDRRLNVSVRAEVQQIEVAIVGS